MAIWRTPLVPVGLVLLVLGLGNWIVGHRKVLEYERLLARSDRPLRVERFAEFGELTQRTNASLLKSFQASTDTTSLVEAKLDFYQIVHAGGRLLLLAGWFSVAAGLIHYGYRRRSNRHDALAVQPG